MTRNRMHRTILMVLYANGLRRTEASRLKVSDIEGQRMVVHAARGKGLRDRDVPLTPKLLEVLRDYRRWKKPRVYLFPSKVSTVERPISDKTVWNSCRVAAVATRAGFKKRMSLHTLRHYAESSRLKPG